MMVEDILLAIVLFILGCMALFALVGLVTTSNRRMNCYVFDHKDWKRWRYIQKKMAFCLCRVRDNGDRLEFDFIPSEPKLFPCGIYSLFYHKEERMCTLWLGDECILSMYDEYNPRKTAQMLEDIIKEYVFK